VIVVRLDRLHSTPRPADLTSAVVYSAQADDVQSVVIDGRLVMRERELLLMDEREVITEANRQSQLLQERAGIQ
jgi:5-methylthioadenosine/S-adenosylhomocysteine deaminase